MTGEDTTDNVPLPYSKSKINKNGQICTGARAQLILLN